MKTSIVCYPKINLCLYVGKKRSDGYHSLSSIFQLVKDSPYFDEITLYITQSYNTEISVFGLDFYSKEKESTAYKAAEKYLDFCGISANVRIDVKKGIPSPSGLGGPSSDAGGVLNALNGVFGKLSVEKLTELSAQIGSDAPFFTSGFETAFVEGRGEIVSQITSRTDLKYDIIPKSEQKKSTKEAYELLDKRAGNTSLPDKNVLIEKYYEKVSGWDFTNDFKILYNSVESEKGFYLSGSGPYGFTVAEVR